MSRLDELKAQRAQLEALIGSGVLTGEAAGQARDRLEAQIAAADSPAAAGGGIDGGGGGAGGGGVGVGVGVGGGGGGGGGDRGGGGAAAAKLPSVPGAAAAAERASPRLLLGLLVFVVLFGMAGYAWLGNPAGLAVGPGGPAVVQAESGPQMPSPADFAVMTERLAERLKATPDDAEGWTMLGRSYSLLERYPQALQAFRRVLALQPQAAQAHADVADALAMVNDRKLDGEPAQLISRALALDPDNAKALGLAGTLAFERGDAATAARHWQRALQATAPGSDMASRLRLAVDEARKSAGLPALAALAVLPAVPAVPAVPASPVVAAVAAVAAAPGPVGSQGATKPATTPANGASDPARMGPAVSVQVRITLAPALAARAAPTDTVFIFARSPQAGRAPLAIQRRQVKDLPLDITLDDSMAMSPALRLSTASQVVIGARISKSGNAMPQPGDLQGLSPVVAVGTQGLLLLINDVLP